ncbi:MAG: cell division protein FtsZ [Patescibacteria group bacterium]
MAEIKPEVETFAKIKVVGIGGSGGSAINRMISSKIRGVEFIAMNTDVQALHYSQAGIKLHIGKATTRGLGAGMDPDLGTRSAEESEDEIREALKGADMIFITCGLGGGTGSGAGPKVAEIAKELGALTVAVVTRPFLFEGAQRKNIADAAFERMVDVVDMIITIPNDRVLQIIDRKTSLLDAFEIVDDVLRQGVQGISEIITVPGLINVDFADVRAIMSDRGSALMGIGRGTGENRAAEAAKNAVASPLLEISIDGAKGILFTITGGSNLGMYEVSEAAKVITQSTDANAKVIFGAIIDESMKDEVKVTVIATGFDTRLPGMKNKSALVSGAFSSSRIPEPLDRMSFAGKQVSASPFKQSEPAYNDQSGDRMEQSVNQIKQESKVEQTRQEPQPAVNQPHIKTPNYAPVQQVRPEQQQTPPPRVHNKPQTEDEELEIPAFIRKKLM